MNKTSVLIIGLIVALVGCSKRAATHRNNDAPRFQKNLSTPKTPPLMTNITGRLADIRQTPATPTRYIVRTAQMTVIVDDLPKSRQAIVSAVAALGGYIHASNVVENYDRRQVELVLKVPAKRFDGAMTKLRRLGRVKQESVSTEEVTATVIDLQARIKNLRLAEARFQALLTNHKGKIDDLLKVEMQVTRVRGDIERFEAQLRNTMSRVTMATVRITLFGPRAPQAVIPPTSNWGKIKAAFALGFQHVVDFGLSLIVLLGHLWLFLFIGILALSAVVTVRRRRRAVA